MVRSLGARWLLVINALAARCRWILVVPVLALTVSAFFQARRNFRRWLGLFYQAACLRRPCRQLLRRVDHSIYVSYLCLRNVLQILAVLGTNTPYGQFFLAAEIEHRFSFSLALLLSFSLPIGVGSAVDVAVGAGVVVSVGSGVGELVGLMGRDVGKIPGGGACSAGSSRLI